jgi:hypothetical protein
MVNPINFGVQLNYTLIVVIAVTTLMGGCMSSKEPVEPVVFPEEAMLFLEAGLRPEVLLFPEYFLMEDFELNQHGNIPASDLVGAGLRTKLDLNVSMRRFNDALDSNGWTTEKTELGKKSFRTLASTADEFIEIRAVQGDDVTEIFVLYRPKSIADSVKKY